MQIENLSDAQVKTMQELCDSWGGQVKHKTFGMEDMDFSKRLTAIEESVAELHRKIDRIFGAYNLIEGQWVDIEKRARKAMKKGGFNHG
jgi:hypothetical protein